MLSNAPIRQFDRSSVNTAIILGGPSVCTQHADLINHLCHNGRTHIVGVNGAWRAWRCDEIVTMDARWLAETLAEGQVQKEDSRIVFIRRPSVMKFDDPSVLNIDAVEGVSPNGPHCFSPFAGISHGENSGFAAMCYTAAMRGGLIFVFGLDLVNAGDGKLWWHDQYGPPQQDQMMKGMGIYRAFFEWGALFRDFRDRFINMNIVSSVRGYPFGEIT